MEPGDREDDPDTDDIGADEDGSPFRASKRRPIRSRSGRETTVWMPYENDQRWKALKARGQMYSLNDLISLGLDVAEAKNRDPVQEFCLQMVRDIRGRLAEFGLVPYGDPDGEEETDRAYVLTRRPPKGTVAPLREGRRPPGAKVRGT